MFLSKNKKVIIVKTYHYKWLANVTFGFHLLWILVLLGGLGLQYILPWYEKFHLAAVMTTIVSQVLWLGCPLTTLECALRRKYDKETSYYGSFIAYFLNKYFGINISSKVVIAQLAIVAIISIYLAV